MSDKKLDPEVAQFFDRHWKTSPVALALAYHLFDDESAIAGNDKDRRAKVERLTKERDEARIDVDRLLALLRRVVEAEDDDASPFYCNPYRRHAHVVEGVWDSDNGPKSGTGCAVCALWAEVRAVIAAALGAAR